MTDSTSMGSKGTAGETPENYADLATVVEALIFGADEPVQVDTIAQVYAEVKGSGRPPKADVQSAVERLNIEYESAGRCVRIYEWGEGYRMATIPEVAPYLKVFLDQKRSRRLSRSLLETLAVVAYRQPVTKPEVDFVRGVDSDYGLRKLMELDMIDVIGRSDAVGRPLLYGTSKTFLEKFGMRNLEDLPNLREVEEILSDPAFNSEKARVVLRDSLGGVQTSSMADGPETASAKAAEATNGKAEPMRDGDRGAD